MWRLGDLQYPEIDPERMCMLGASYGGYMANWMQGHNDSLGFKTIVCHDGGESCASASPTERTR